MRRREKFGKLVLLDEPEVVHMGASHLAARLGPTGLDRLVSLLRFSEKVSAHPDVAARLMDQLRRTARLGLRGLVQILGIGRVGTAYYASCQLTEGRSLRAVITRSRREGFPFPVENALMVASRAAAVLQTLHERKDDDGTPLFHGLLTPLGLVVSWEGEVQVREVGLWGGLRGSPLAAEIERLALAPEQRSGDGGDARSDVHALAVVLLETLTGWSPDSGTDPREALSTATAPGVTGEPEPPPAPIREILERALAPEPSERYRDMAEMRQAIDTLLFSGDFSPTTFNLAFFMQTLFREDMEGETKALAEARGADYSEFLPAPTRPEKAPAVAEPPPPPEEGPTDAGERDPATVRLTAPPPAEVAPAGPPKAASAGPDTSGPSSSGRRPRPGGQGPGFLSPSSSGRLLASASRGAPQRGRVLVGGVVLALLVGGGGGYLYFTRLTPASEADPARALASEAALSRVHQLEEALARLEREKAELEAAMRASTVTDETGAEPPPDGHPEVPAVSSPRPVTPTPDTRADDEARARAEARRRARADAARREEQIRRLEEEIRVAQGQLVAEQATATRPLDLGAALPVPDTTIPTPEPPPATLPPVLPGELVDISDPEVSDPELLDEGPDELLYPSAAKWWRRSATVVVDALVGEDGRVLEARAVESSVEGMGFEASAERKVRLFRYRPAQKRGVAVRVRILVPVRFAAP